MPHGADQALGPLNARALPLLRQSPLSAEALARAPTDGRGRLYLLGGVEHFGAVDDTLATPGEIHQNFVAEGRKPLRPMVRFRTDDAVALAAPATVAAAINDDVRAVSDRALRLRGKTWLTRYSHCSSPAAQPL